MRQLYFPIALLLLFGLQSCDEEERFAPIELDITGITVKNEYNVCSFYGDISSSENYLTFIASGKNAKYGFLTEFCVGNECYNFSECDYDTEQNIIASGDWGHIELTNSIPYTTKVCISENVSSTNRNLKFTFGGGYTVSWVYITQNHKK